MRTRFFAVALVVVMAAALVVGGVAQAQDEMMTHTCDSTLILLLYIAEHDYGFHSMMDVLTFEKGQYAPLFDAMMAEMEGEMMEGDMMATEEAMMEGDMMMLSPGNVEGEDTACTDLRAEIEAFLYKTLLADMMMEEPGS
jgi:hypothetical protein